MLAAYLGSDRPLGDHLAERVFADAAVRVAEPLADDVAGYAAYLDRYRAGIAVEAAAVAAL